MVYEKDSTRWAESTFGQCNLDDPRRLKRLVDIAARLSDDPSGSISSICRGDGAAKEGAYKFVENQAVRPDAIGEGVFQQTAKLVKSRRVCLAIQDTTAVDVSYSLRENWKEQGSPSGYQVHSTLAIDGQSLELIGLLDQSRWLRPPKGQRPGKKTRASRAPKEKESYKWRAALEAIENRLFSLENVISVCDREADVYDFLNFQTQRNYRFVIRATHDRKLVGSDEHIMKKLRRSPVLGRHLVTIGQRGKQRANKGQQPRKARQGRVAKTELRALQLDLAAPSKAKGEAGKSIPVNVILVNEINPPVKKDGICWLLLTTEPINSLEQVLNVVKYYSARWQIEEFHKAWKTGCRMEQRRLQTHENFERLMMITAPIAVRILQLRSLSDDEEKGCDFVFEKDEWQCLFASTNPGTPLPDQPPSAQWAYYALAKLAGWTDSKRTGRVGWQTLWTGWERLQISLTGWRAAIQMGAMK